MKLVSVLVLASAAAIFATSCAHWSPALADPASAGARRYAAESAEVIELLDYFQRISNLPADELRREYNAVGQLYARDRSENARLRVALLLSLPNTSFRDDSRLISVLEATPPRPAGADTATPYRQLNLLLLKLANDRLRQVREEQKRGELTPKDDVKHLEEQSRRLEMQLAEEKKRADELQKKLDALITIERELRSKSPQRPRVPAAPNKP